jgi:cysteine-rich repeat protein
MTCGNGKVEVIAGEQCDDGNKKKGDGCDNKCQIEPGFQCYVEMGAEDGLSYCKRCRDGKVDAGEACDDGNELRFDGCDPYCYVEEGWWCRQYDCSLNGLDYPCPATDMAGRSFCKPDVCGDGIVWHNEQCDDGNNVDFDGCSSQCKTEPGFTCESTDSADKYARSRCYNCGNGIIDFAEDCDDSNTEDGDGCSALCFLEAGAAYVDANGEGGGANFTCTKAPSTRTVVTLFESEEVNASTTTTATTTLVDGAPTTTATTTLVDGAPTAANESGADRMLLTEVMSTHCKKVIPYHEQNQDNLILYAAGTVMFCVMGTVLGLLVHKWHKNKLRLKQGEVLSIGSDGRVKKVNTLTAILVVQMQLKRQIKRRRELKAMEEEALKKQELLKKQAARLQEKKWRKAMQEGPDEAAEPNQNNVTNNYVSDHV